MKLASLGTLEQQVMDILWENKSCSSRDVLGKLKREKKPAYTTIATILQRLYDKGLLNRKAEMTGIIYTPKITKEKFSTSVAQFFLKNFINSFGDTAIASFAESIDKLPIEKRNYFLKLLEGNDKDK